MGATLVGLDAMLPALDPQRLRRQLQRRSRPRSTSTVARPLTGTGAALACTDHMPEGPTTRARRHASAGAKLQLVDVSYAVKLTRAFSRDRAGSLVVTAAKDRYGGFAIGEHVARVDLEPEAGGRLVTVAVRTPTATPTRRSGPPC